MGVSSFTQEMIRNSIDNKKSILEIIQKFDFAIEDFIEKEKVIPLSSLPISVQEMFEKNHNISGNETVKEVSFHFTHKSFDSNNDNEGDIEIPMRNQSGGTKKLFEELGPIIDTLQHGKILIFDELNTCFHPKILKAIVDLFHDKEANPHNAQLIFTTHETSLLAYAKDEIDRDAFWFTERDAYGRASLFSLSEFKERKDSANIDKKYLEGRYGAVPFINTIVDDLL
jgi:AAA15 family ATPase/GTPase